MKVVIKGNFFGCTQVNTKITEELSEMFSETALLFVAEEIPACDIPRSWTMYKEKPDTKSIKETNKENLVTKMVKILLYMLMIYWYLQNGLRLTVVY